MYEIADVWWKSNYKAMDQSQLISEMKRIHYSPHFIDDREQRLNYLAMELSIKTRYEF